MIWVGDFGVGDLAHKEVLAATELSHVLSCTCLKAWLNGCLDSIALGLLLLPFCSRTLVNTDTKDQGPDLKDGNTIYLLRIYNQ